MKRKSIYIFGGIVILFVIVSNLSPGPKNSQIQNVKQGIPTSNTEESKTLGVTESKTPANLSKLYSVVSVVDGDTIKVNIEGEVKTFRLIGLDTPETVDPRKTVQCFGKEASNKAKELLSGKKVRIETDDSQGTYDKYQRLLAYVHREDGLFFNKYMIEEGYAHEYTYGTPYKYQTEFKSAQKQAEADKAGLWSPDTCNGNTTSSAKTSAPANTSGATGSCDIKGNIGSTKEKIYHVVGCGSYDKTVIDESKGEKYFCSEKEALDAGWRKALNCN